MALFVLCDPNYRHGVWCDAKLKGIMDEAARRRIQPEVFVSVDALKTVLGKSGEEASVILLFDSIYWLQKTVCELMKFNVHLILSANYVNVLLPVVYSIAGTDIDGAMRDMVDYLHSCGKYRIALVGVNKDSCNDTGRALMFHRYVPESEGQLFYIDGNADDCFSDFLKVQNNFDAAICTNDLLAIRLIEYLKSSSSKENLFVISHTDTVMARLYGDGITSMTTNFYNCGRLLVETYFSRLKYGLASSANMLPASLKIRGSTNSIQYSRSKDMLMPVEHIEPVSPKPIVAQTGKIGRLERLLASSDLVNLKLMYCLICGYNYEKMSEYCFISAETARYRVRKIKLALDVDTKNEATEFIGKYIKKDSLLSTIAEMEEKNNRILV